MNRTSLCPTVCRQTGLVLVFAFVSLAAGCHVSQFPQSVKDRTVAATVLVYRGRVSGTGVVSSRHGRCGEVLTAWHCLDGDAPIFVWTTTSAAWLPAQLVSRDTAHDLARLTFEHDAIPAPLTLAPAPAQPGEAIMTAGWADDASIGPTLLEMTARDLSGHWRVVSHPGRPGRSGGPAVNTKGDIVGICYGNRGEEGLYTDVQHVHGFIVIVPIVLAKGQTWQTRLGGIHLTISAKEE